MIAPPNEAANDLSDFAMPRPLVWSDIEIGEQDGVIRVGSAKPQPLVQSGMSSVRLVGFQISAVVDVVTVRRAPLLRLRRDFLPDAKATDSR